MTDRLSFPLLDSQLPRDPRLRWHPIRDSEDCARVKYADKLSLRTDAPAVDTQETSQASTRRFWHNSTLRTAATVLVIIFSMLAMAAIVCFPQSHW